MTLIISDMTLIVVATSFPVHTKAQKAATSIMGKKSKAEKKSKKEQLDQMQQSEEESSGSESESEDDESSFDLSDEMDGFDDLDFHEIGREHIDEIDDYRDPDTCNFVGIFHGFNKKGRAVPVLEEPQKGYDMYVLITEFPGFKPIKEKLRYAPKTKGSDDHGNTIEINGQVKMHEDVRNFLTEHEEEMPPDFNWVPISKGDYVKIKCWQPEYKSVAKPGDLIRLNGIRAAFFNYFYSKPNKSNSKKKEQTEEEKKKEEEEQQAKIQRKDNIRTARQFTCAAISLLKSNVKGSSVIQQKIKLFKGLRKSPIRYETILHIGSATKDDPNGTTKWVARLCSVKNNTIAFKQATKGDTNALTNLREGQEAKDFHKKQLNLDMVFMRYNVDEDPKKLMDEGKKPIGLVCKLWDEDCARLMLITKQSRWFEIMKAWHPALDEMYVVGKYNLRSNGLAINLDPEHPGKMKNKFIFEARWVFYDLEEALRKYAFKVSKEWVANHFHPDAKKKHKPLFNDTQDADRPEQMKMIYPGKASEARVKNLSNWPGVNCDEDEYEYRVVTSEWFEKDRDYTTKEGMFLQKRWLAKAGSLSTKKAEHCLNGAAPLKKLSVSGESIMEVYAIPKRREKSGK